MQDFTDILCRTTCYVSNNLIQFLDENSGSLTTVACTVAATLAVQKAYQLYQGWDSQQLKKNFQNRFYQVLENNNVTVRNKINKEINGMLSEIQADIDQARSVWQPISELPPQGLKNSEILKRFEQLHSHYAHGKLSGAVYAEYDDPELLQLLQHIWSITALTNPMHSEWQFINLMEAELIAMTQDLLHGENGWPGIVTHGGSTSILEACKAYVFAARDKGIQSPEIIVPESAHIAFEKAAKILHAKLIKVPVDPATGAADVKATQKAITRNTCMLVGSAPSFPSGIIDPIQALGELALQYDIPLHVDACLGGFLTVFAKEAGFDLPACDFSVPGVTSISIDTHKYGQTPKGTSILLFNDKVAATTTHTHLEWPGGMYVTPSIDGSRSGADIALAWAVLCYRGKAAYVEDTRRILTLQRELLEAIKKIDGIIVPYNPLLSVIPIKSESGINSLLIADLLKLSGWSVNILQTAQQQPNGFHFCLTVVHANQKDFMQKFVADLTEATLYAKAHPDEQPKGMTKAYGHLNIAPYLRERVGQGYIKILNTLPGLNTWFKQPEEVKTALEEHDPALISMITSEVCSIM